MQRRMSKTRSFAVRLKRLALVWLAILVAVLSPLVSTNRASAANAPADLYFPFTYPMNGTVGGRVGINHDGYDMYAYGGTGAPIYASYTGKVTVAGLAGNSACGGTGTGYGYVVQVSHGNNIETRYAHLSSNLLVAAGQYVTTGQLIGYQGISGASNCVQHLHFELKNTATGVWMNVNPQMAGVPYLGGVTAQGPIGFSGSWQLRDNVSSGGTTKTVLYGVSGDIPITGDWNGDSYDTLGVVRYNTTTGHFDWWQSDAKLTTLANNSYAPVSNVISTYGDPGDTPIVGDWDGVGGDSIGVIGPSGGLNYWYLLTVPFFPFVWGLHSDNPTSGDWNCDGRDSPGITRQNGAGGINWNLDNEFGSTIDYPLFLWGESYPGLSDHGVSSRWNSSLCSRPMIVRNGANQWLATTGFPGSLGLNMTWAAANDVPLPADWDNDSYDDFIAVA